MPTDDTPAHEHIGKYTLIRALAQGGMAELFLAKQFGPAGFEKIVAIKRVLPHLAHDEKFIEMFLDEARLAARLVHPNIVAVHDFGEVEGTWFLCMELLEGRDLDAILRILRRKRRSISPTIAALIASAACDGLHYAHTFADEQGRPLGLVHRDISPSNLFVTHQGAVKILDFGIARTTARQSRTEVGLIKGKLHFMSPEQVMNRPLDARSDLFSLGMVLYVLLTGIHPFSRDNPAASVRALVEEDAPDPLMHRADLPEQLGAILSRALQRDPAQRYASAQEMRNDLDQFLATRTSIPGASQLQGFMRELMEGVEDAATPVRAAPGETAQAPQEPPPFEPSQVEATSAIPSRGIPPRRRGRWVVQGLLALLGLGALAAAGFTLWPGVGQAPPLSMHESAAVHPSPPPFPPERQAPPPGSPTIASMEAAPQPAPDERPPAPVTLSPARHRTPIDPVSPAEHKSGAGYPPSGLLSVNCLPWCTIQVDGSDEGLKSPLLNYRLTAGPHRLRVMNPISQVEREQPVHVLAGRTTVMTVRFGRDTVVSIQHD